MAYQGGKSRCAELIAGRVKLLADAHGFTEVEDRFCGSLAVSAACRDLGLHVAVVEDGNPALMGLYQALRDGWQPPSELTSSDYAAIRIRNDACDPLTGFALGFCSYGGRWGRGFKPDDHRWPGASARFAAARARALLLSRVPLLVDAELRTGPCTSPLGPRRVGYADPPYRGTAAYPGAPPIDLPSAWERLRSAGPLLASETEAWPVGWREVLRWINPRRQLRSRGAVELLLVRT